MTTSRERVVNALNFEPVDRIPRDLWLPPESMSRRRDELAELLLRFPSDFERPSGFYPAGKRTSGDRSTPGAYTDAWGCTWEISHTDGSATLLRPAITSKKKMCTYEPPMEVVENLDPTPVDEIAAESSRFVLPWTDISLVRRMISLVGEERFQTEIRDTASDIFALLEAIDTYNTAEIEKWAESNVDGIMLVDDWADANRLNLPLGVLRNHILPRLAHYGEILCEADKFVFLSVTGNITKILPELIEAGIDCLHTDLAGWDLERSAESIRGKLAIWAAPAIETSSSSDTEESGPRETIQRLVKVFQPQNGGFIAGFTWDESVSFYSACAVFDEWNFAVGTPSA
ncbi:hypothetical protein [Thermostilla marina]